MKVSPQEIASLINNLFEQLKAQDDFKTPIEIAEDAYWFVSKEALYDMQAAPADLTIGSIYDDLQELKARTQPNSPTVAYDLVKACSLLRFIGEKYI